jgi:outer membrane protein assembly factor BamB
VVGSYDGTVYGIDRGTGEVRWSQEVGSSAAVTIDNGVVYAITIDGRVLAIGNA